MNSHNNYATLQEFIDLTPDAMVLVDAAGKIVLVNRYVETLFGYSPTNLLGHSIETLIPPRFRAAHAGHYHKSFTAAPHRPMETGLEVFGLCKNGREIPIDVSFNRVNLADQPLVVCVIRDLSQKKQADENLKHALHRYRTLFEDAPAMYVFLGDENGVPIIVNCNEKFVTTLGYPKIDMLGRPLTDFYSPASAIELERNYPRVKNGELVTGERELVTRSGAIIQTLMRAVPELDPDRQLLSLRAMFIDITERKQAEENLQHYVHRVDTLHQIDRAILSQDPLPEIAAIALRQLQHLVACYSTWVMLFDAPIHTGTILASVGIDDPQFAPNQVIKLNGSLVQSCLPHKYQLIEDLTRVEYTPDGQRLLAQGIVSLIVIPLKIRGNAVGVLGMGALSKEVFTPTNLEFAYEVTNQLAVAVHNRHLLEQNQLHTEMLERRVLERTAALSEANEQLQLQIAKREQTQQALRLQEKRLRSLYEITAITDAPIDEKLNAVLVIGVTLLEMQVGVISRIIDNQWCVTHVYSLNDQLAVGQTFALDTTLFDLAIAQKTVISIDNVAHSPHQNHPYFSHCNHQAYIGVQLWVGEACYGALSFASARPCPEPFSPADEDFVRLMGQWIGNRLEQEEAEAALAEEKNLLRTLVDNLPDYIFVKDKEHRYVINNLAHLRLLGLSAQEETAGKTDFDFFPPESVARIHALESAILETGQPIMNQEEQAGDNRWWRTTKVPLYTNQGKISGLVGINYDITVQKLATLQSIQQAKILAQINSELTKTNQQLQAEVMRREQAEKQLKHDAMHDMLTGLPNRTMFQNKLTQALFRVRQSTRYMFAVLYLDLDRFKVINDTLGHAHGDQLLITVARRLENCVRPRDTVARLGGDEFSILLDDVQSLNHVIDTANLILAKLGQPVNLNGRSVVTGASIGIVQGLASYLEAEDILRDADMAMYRAKQQGVGRYTLFDLNMYSQTLAQAQLEADLQFALERNQFVVYYQPIISLTDGYITGIEAMPYWEHPHRGLLPPEQFLELAEEARITTELNEWLLQTACMQLKQWHEAGLSHIRLALNFNPNQLQQAQTEMILTTLAQIGVSPHHLELEIKESRSLRYDHRDVNGVQALSDIGVRIAIDDFGKGYSSVDRLQRLRLNTIKIPASFMVGLTANYSNQAIVKAIIGLAHNLNISVIAQGIESEEQLDFLQAQQCNEGQGSFFSQHIPAEEIIQLLRHNQNYPFLLQKK